MRVETVFSPITMWRVKEVGGFRVLWVNRTTGEALMDASYEPHLLTSYDWRRDFHTRAVARHYVKAYNAQHPMNRLIGGLH